MAFLENLVRRPLADRGVLAGFGLFVGQGQLGLEIVVYTAAAKPTSAVIQEAWRERRNGRPTPVLVVVLHGALATIAGPTGEDLPIHANVDVGTAERLCAAALDQPDRHAALLFLGQAMPSLDTVAPGLRNEGLFALHELTEDVPRRPDWQAFAASSRAILARRPDGSQLLTALGYTVERLDNMTQLLKGRDRRLALAVLLERTDTPESGNPRFGNLSPVSYALSKADSEGLDWVMVVQGDRLRLYPTKTGVGVGRRGRTETYVEVQTSVLSDERIGYLSLLFSADSLQPEGAVADLLEKSTRFAADLASELRDRIYDRVMPLLAEGVAAARNLTNPDAAALDLTYRMALTILFRLLFVAYAEDKDLLPYQYSEAYRRRSLKLKAQELAEHARNLAGPVPGTSHWDEVRRIWTAIERGDAELSVPAYNGGLFTRDPAVSEAGAQLAGIALPNEVFEPALTALLLSDVDGQLAPVDFRALGVREFGTIYEGLLESELSVAASDLRLDNRGSYVPVTGAHVPVVRQGAIYLHNRSGARKASGSYFTKAFAVEHLLDRALVPALTDHLTRVAAMDEADAAEAFFDFRVADIAMGSGHFLVAAVDAIERGMTDYLARPQARGSAGIRAELARLREAARGSLGAMAENQRELEDSQLLRRLIARRCIYGVDQNPLSVQLSRLAMWIHTFVPGLPLSVLDHNLVHGNSLVGVGTVREIEEKFEEAGTALFPVDAQSLLSRAAQPLRRLANLADATLTDVQHAREAMEEARLSVADTKALCDIITAQRLDSTIDFQFERWEEQRATIQRSAITTAARNALAGLEVFHFPIAFPEVFLRRRSGFDVLLGNPPWQEATIEDHAFWARHFPGLRALRPAEMDRERERLRRARPDLEVLLAQEQAEAAKMRKTLTSGAYPGMGTGDPDLYKAFMWRFWNLASLVGGRIGVVLPRSAFAAKGSTLFRQAIFEQAADVDLTMTLNTRGWVFDEAEHRYTIALVAIERGEPVGQTISLRGPFGDLQSFLMGKNEDAARFTAAAVLSWNDTASLPLLPTNESIGVFAQLRAAPRLDLNDGISWRARPDGELHATAQRPLMDFHSERPETYWPIFKGESFDLWQPDRGPDTYYAWADPDVAADWLYGKRLRASAGGPHAEFPREYRQRRDTLSCLSARVVFRDVTNRTNQRTLVAALVPGNVFLTNKAPYLLWLRGDERDQAYLLAVLSSRCLDWYARRFVELNMNFFIFNPLPVPRPPSDSPLWQRAIALAGRLAAPDDRFAEWAAAVGVEHGPLAADVKQAMIDELDAVVAHLYGLSADQFTHIFETFHEGWDYAPRLAAVMVHFEDWAERTRA